MDGNFVILTKKLRRHFFMASMEPCRVRRLVANFGQPRFCSFNKPDQHAEHDSG